MFLFCAKNENIFKVFSTRSPKYFRHSHSGITADKEARAACSSRVPALNDATFPIEKFQLLQLSIEK